MPAYAKLAGETYHVRGSPSSIIYRSSDALYIVDPGHGSGKVKSLSKAVRDLSGGRPVIAFITHYHSDHLEAVARKPGLFTKTISTVLDKPGIEDPLIRITMTFGYPMDPSAGLLPFRAPPVSVHETVRCGESIGPLRTVHLPGHTPGQVGVLTPDGVLFAADALFGDKVLERYPLPYHLDPCSAKRSLEIIARERWDYIVPAHGPVLDREPGLELIDKNITKINDMITRILIHLDNPMPAEELTRQLVAQKSSSPGMYMLLEQTVRGALACMEKQNLVKAELIEGRLVWAKTE